MGSHFVVSVVLKALDRPGLLRDVTGVMADHQVNVLSTMTSTSGADRVATMHFDFEIVDPTHLETLLRVLRRVDSVYDVHRAVQGSPDLIDDADGPADVPADLPADRG
jgi:GTP pyrophosphokinase